MDLIRPIRGWGIVVVLGASILTSADARKVALGFESGLESWNRQGSGWSVYGRRSSEGKKSVRCLVEKKSPAGIRICAYPVKGVNPGALITVQVDAAGRAKSGSSRASLGLICLDSSGGVVREFTRRLEPIDSDFRTFSIEENMVPSGTKEVVLVLAVEVLRVPDADDWWCFDQVVINIE